MELGGVNRLRCEQIMVAQPRFTPAGGVPCAGQLSQKKKKKSQLSFTVVQWSREFTVYSQQTNAPGNCVMMKYLSKGSNYYYSGGCIPDELGE